MKKRKLTKSFLGILITALLFSHIACAGSSPRTTDTEEKPTINNSENKTDKEASFYPGSIINNTNEEVSVSIGSYDPEYSETVNISPIKVNSKYDVESTLIPDTKTDYLITVNNTYSGVIYADRVKRDFFKSPSWRLTIPSPDYTNNHPITMYNDSTDNVSVYIGAWDGNSYIATNIGIIPPKSLATFQHSNIKLNPDYYYHIFIKYENVDWISYSKWFTIEDFGKTDWKLLLPEHKSSVWDGRFCYFINNLTNDDLDIYIHYTDEIWKNRSEDSYGFLGRFKANSTSQTKFYPAGGMINYKYMVIIEAVNKQGVLISHQLYTEDQFMYWGFQILISPPAGR
jgi:hypothetical protein